MRGAFTLALTDHAGQLQAIDAGQVQIHQRNINARFAERRQRGKPMCGMCHAQAFAFEHAADHRGDGRIVFDDQHVDALMRAPCLRIRVRTSDR